MKALLALALMLAVLGVAYGNSPGFPFLGVQVPINFDPLLQLFLAHSGTIAPLPAPGFRSLRIALPHPSPLLGVPVFGAHVMLDLGTLTVPGLSSALPFVMP